MTTGNNFPSVQTTTCLQLHSFNHFSILPKENPKSLLPSILADTFLCPSFPLWRTLLRFLPQNTSPETFQLRIFACANPLPEQPFLWFTICFFTSCRSGTQVSHFGEDLSWLPYLKYYHRPITILYSIYLGLVFFIALTSNSYSLSIYQIFFLRGGSVFSIGMWALWEKRFYFLYVYITCVYNLA